MGRRHAVHQGRLTDFRCNLSTLTLDELDELEVECGRSFYALAAPTTATELAEALVAVASREMPREEAEAQVKALTVRDLDRVSLDFVNDLPSMFDGYLPDIGGRTADQYVCLFAGPPWGWPPDVTRRQRLRDLRLLADAFS